MSKYRVSADAENRIDYCPDCDDVWLDGGEWELIDALVGSDSLAAITTQPWQYRVTKNIEANLEEKRLRALLGNDYERLLETSDWLDGHPARQEILAYFVEKSR